MTLNDLLGIVKEFLLEEDREVRTMARLALADVFSENGDDATARALRDKGVPIWVCPQNQYDARLMAEHGIETALRIAREHFSSIGEREAFILGMKVIVHDFVGNTIQTCEYFKTEEEARQYFLDSLEN